MTTIESIEKKISILKGFPEPGLTYYDIRSIKSDPTSFSDTIRAFQNDVGPFAPDILIGHKQRPDFVAALSYVLGIGYALAYPKEMQRPGAVYQFGGISINQDVLESAKGAASGGAFRAVLVDELVLGGDDAISITGAIQQAGGKLVHAAVLLEVFDRAARETLQQRGVSLTSLIRYSQRDGFLPGKDEQCIYELADDETSDFQAQHPGSPHTSVVSKLPPP